MINNPLTPEQADVYLKILSHDFQRKEGIKRIRGVFEWGGRIFLRDLDGAAGSFALSNNKGDFYVWAQNNIRWVSDAPQATKWISIDEQTPDGEVLAINDRKDIIIGYISGQTCENECTILEDVTHWMPLPEPPKVG